MPRPSGPGNELPRLALCWTVEHSLESLASCGMWPLEDPGRQGGQWMHSPVLGTPLPSGQILPLRHPVMHTTSPFPIKILRKVQTRWLTAPWKPGQEAAGTVLVIRLRHSGLSKHLTSQDWTLSPSRLGLGREMGLPEQFGHLNYRRDSPR